MDKKLLLIQKIIDIEWDMFAHVHGIDEQKAACQEEPKTFEIMRSSQLKSWSEELLKSYLNDLNQAKKDGKNLPAEKYAHMMKSTDPEAYNKIKSLLPQIDPETADIIEKIIHIEDQWEKEFIAKFPKIAKKGRPANSKDDSSYFTSKETYARGELSTYSSNTVQLYYKNCLELKEKKLNASELIRQETVKRYGYNSLEDACSHL